MEIFFLLLLLIYLSICIVNELIIYLPAIKLLIKGIWILCLEVFLLVLLIYVCLLFIGKSIFLISTVLLLKLWNIWKEFCLFFNINCFLIIKITLAIDYWIIPAFKIKVLFTEMSRLFRNASHFRMSKAILIGLIFYY